MQSWQDNWQKLYQQGKWFDAFFYWADKVKDVQALDLDSEEVWVLLEQYGVDDEINRLTEECLNQQQDQLLNVVNSTSDGNQSIKAKASELIGRDVVDKLTKNGLTIISNKELEILINSYLHNLIAMTEEETRKYVQDVANSSKKNERKIW